MSNPSIYIAYTHHLLWNSCDVNQEIPAVPPLVWFPQVEADEHKLGQVEKERNQKY